TLSSKPPRPQPLVHLTTLKFGNTTLEYPLQEYFALPKLKHLEIWQILFEPSQEDEDPDSVASQSKQSFLKEFPNLETISIRQTTLDGHLVDVLQRCPRLKNLELESLVGFSHSFSPHRCLVAFISSPDYNPRLYFAVNQTFPTAQNNGRQHYATISPSKTLSNASR
ncbi:17265_t:CDS:2, partial [Acaulospora colombiana]